MERCYGFCRDISKGKRKNSGADGAIPCILEPALTDKTFRRNWARLKKNIHEVGPPTPWTLIFSRVLRNHAGVRPKKPALHEALPEISA
jgi:hypothetical protein